MKKIYYIMLLTVIFILNACNHTEYILMGDDHIKLSVKEHRFGKEKDSLVVTTEGDSWWMKRYVITNNVLDTTVRITKYDSIRNEVLEFQSGWFRVTREAVKAKKLLIQVDANDSGMERWFNVELSEGNRGSSLKIIQSAE
jgi:hypothetical protein